jgi:hypothetical protein
MVGRRRAGWVLGALLASCTPPTSSGPTATASDALEAPPAPSERDVAVLVVEARGGALRVLAAQRVAARDLGPGQRFNGRGPPAYRWTLRGARGEELDGGPISVRRGANVPPNPSLGAPAAQADRDATTFVVRAPHPVGEESIEIASIDGQEVVGWRP